MYVYILEERRKEERGIKHGTRRTILFFVQFIQFCYFLSLYIPVLTACYTWTLCG